VVELIVTWLAALATLGIYSILYKENPIYRFFEHLFIGLGLGWTIFEAWKDILQPKWWTPMVIEGKWYWIFAFVIGSLYYFIFSPRFAWMARLVISTMMGLTAGLVFKVITALYIPQIEASFRPITFIPSIARGINNLLSTIILLCVILYFLFTISHEKQPLAGASKVGRWFIMLGLGAMFGSTVMARLSLFIDRLTFLLHDWLKVIKF
jgi:hypothetical protein